MQNILHLFVLFYMLFYWVYFTYHVITKCTETSEQKTTCGHMLDVHAYIQLTTVI